MHSSHNRLSRDLCPVHYHIRISADIYSSSNQFNGICTIILSVDPQWNQQMITFHALGLKFGAITLLKSDDPWNGQDRPNMSGENVEIEGVEVDEHWEIAQIKLNNRICVRENGYLMLRIEYTGEFNPTMRGFYLSKWKDERIGTTQFEPTDARRAFPCWDEPSFKATFSIDIESPGREYQVISNMPVLKLTSENEKILYQFEKSPIMSTYLVAFVVGKFDYIAGHTKDGVQVKIYAMPGKINQAEFALNVAIKAMDFFVDFFGINYPLPKVDLLGIPDFAAGAMENWGCITYREIRLLVDPIATSVETKQRTARTICHELAHMWFGNLVTMEWWTHLWLNEGFARFMEFYAVDHIFPNWNIWNNFLTEVYDSALSLDSLKNSHPIEVEVENAKDVDSIFDTISYAKGASIIRMLVHFIGFDNFKLSVQNYLKKFSYANTFTRDLWQEFQNFYEASANYKQISVPVLMKSWTEVVGYPVVSSSISSGKLHLCQKRFLRDGSLSDSESIWSIPIRIHFLDDDSKLVAQYTVVLDKKEEIFQFEKFTGNFILNSQRAGFYRVHYADANAYSRVNSNMLSSLSQIDVLSLLEDAFALGNSGEISITNYLNLASQLKFELSFTLFSAILDNISFLISLHGEQAYFEQLKSFLSQIVSSCLLKYKDIDLNRIGQDESESLFESRAFTSSLILRDDESLKRKLIDLILQTDPLKNLIRADLRGAIYKFTVKNDRDRSYEKILGLYRNTDISEERNRCIHALASSKSEDLISKTLNWALFSGEVRAQDLHLVFAGSSTSGLGRRISWEFLKTNWETLRKVCNRNICASIVSSTLSGFTDDTIRDEISSFFNSVEYPFAYSEISKVLERISIRSKTLQRQSKDLSAMFALH